MCGIAGVVELRGSQSQRGERVAELEGMLDRIAHRGPDAAGIFVDDHAALGAVRLSINDLENGHQPMADARQRFVVVYNGEIYNHVELREELERLGHRFETRCDTEVALRAWMEWGEDAPGRFEGGFAFAVFDREAKVATLVRDRFGKRPLFYRRDGDTILFGSEIKVFLARRELPLRWDARGLAALFAKWTPFGAETPFEGVHQVRAGSLLRVSVDGVEERVYGAPEHPLSTATRDDSPIEEATERLVELLERSVRLRLRSDVEVGLLVSGGLDSSVLAALARKLQPERLRAFSIGFADASFDESRHQRSLVDALGLTHSTIEVTGDDIADHFQAALWHAEIPQFRTAFVPMFLLARRIRELGVKVVLSGEGADEALLGYDLFKEARLRSRWAALDSGERRAMLRGLYPYLPHFSEANLRAIEVTFARSSTDLDAPLASHALRFANARLASSLLHAGDGGLDALTAAVTGLEALAGKSLLRRAQWIEFHTLLQGYLLSSQGDRMTFAHGVESRCPFLSPALVEYAARLPERYLLSESGDEKHLLKRAFGHALPPEIVRRPKQPYRAPDAASFRDAEDPRRFRPWVEELLAESNLRQVDPVDVAAATRFLDKVRSTPRSAVSPREDQAFVLLLSLAVLDRQMVKGSGIPEGAPRPTRPRSIVIAERTRSTHDGAR